MRFRVFGQYRLLGLTALAAATMGVLVSGCGADGRDAATEAPAARVDPLREGFLSPPNEARPRVWWHWMNGNVTEEGIAKDLEWMHRIGIGGLQNFDAAMATPVIVDQRLAYMSPEWKKAFRFAVEKADELDLEFAIASSAGWSLTGGPWVPPEDAMKKLVWSETVISGGTAFDGTLPEPPGTVGPYQAAQAVYKHAHNEDAIPDTFYRDALVLAYPLRDEAPLPAPRAITVNGAAVDAQALFDDSADSGIELPSGGASPTVIELDYAGPQTIRSAVVHIANPPPSFLGGPWRPTLEALVGDDTWQRVAEFPLKAVPTTLSFAPVTAGKFRLVLSRAVQESTSYFVPSPGVDSSGLAGINAMSSAGAKSMLTGLRLFAGAKVNAFETKAGFALSNDYHGLDGDVGPEVEGVDPAAVVNLSDRMNGEGRLQWDAPPGDWKILRLGYSLTGKTNSPATEEATGLEVDKYDAEAVARYIDTYLGMYREVVGDELMGKRGLRALLTDSTEVGPSNWTPKLREQFEKRRGYDPTPWLPALTGEIVGSRARSDGFLYDFRRTLAELSATEHYGTVARIARDNGLVVYGESLEGNRDVSTLGDDLEMRRFADIPMAAMWAFSGAAPAPQYIADMRGAASVAHLYGRKYVATESLTSIMNPWAHAPADLQPMIDAEFVNGINRPVIHTSVHQPVDDKVPGLSLHVFGQFFTRHETWAEMARPWIDYIARNSYLLQQGRNVADVGYFYGEEPPIGVLASTSGYPRDVPTRYAYDFVPPDAVLEELAVDGGDLVTRGGARYRVLYLGGSSRHYMTLPVLKRLAGLVEEGATLVGGAPAASPGQADDGEEFAALVARLWSGEQTTSVGRGQVIAGDDVEAALAQLGLAPDFAAGSGEAVQFVHRQIRDGDIYYLANSGDAVEFEARFRVAGKAPEIWRADSGAIEPVSYHSDGDETVVPLAMGQRESFFVVFREPAAEASRTVPAPVLESVGEINGPWEVRFQADRGAPERVVLDQLQSLAEHDNPGIKYFSGVAAYSKTFELPETGAAGQSLLLDLGAVGDVAEVLVNGQSAGIAWRAPYRLDIGGLVRPGSNTLEVRVANLWVNRLIGDVQPDAERVAYTTFKTYLPGAPLRSSGLMGPVVLVRSVVAQPLH